jgi:hypothetical protein
MFSKLRFSKRRPSPSMVVALIALLVAGGGAAFATIPDSDDGDIHGCYSNRDGKLRVIDAQSGETCSAAKETALVWNQQGAPGTPGSDAASAIMGRTDDVFGGFAEYWAAPSGTSVVTTGGPENSVTHLSPNATMVARDLAVRALIDNSELSAQSVTFELRDETTPTTLLTCTMNVPADVSFAPRTCDSGSSTATVAPKSDLALKIYTSVGTSSAVEVIDIRFGWRATTP